MNANPPVFLCGFATRVVGALYMSVSARNSKSFVTVNWAQNAGMTCVHLER